MQIADLNSASSMHADPEDPHRLSDLQRNIGLVVCRGTSVTLICPTDGMEEIENPYV